MKCISHLDEFNIIGELNKTIYSTVDLLSQNNSALVRNSKTAFELLKMLYNVIHLLAESLDKFYIAKQYQYFDPHVGENACQIRAYAFVILSRKKENNNAIIERIHFFKSHLNRLKKILTERINYKNNSLTVVEFAEKYACYFSVRWDECFLCKSYLLTVVKKSNSQGSYTCSYTLANFFKISRTFSEKIIHQYQSHLSRMSCKFIKTIALDLNINEKNTPSIISSISFDDDKRMVYPCFLSSRLIFMHMKKTECAVLIILNTIDDNNSRKDLILYNKEVKQGRLLTKNNNLIKNEVCVVIQSPRIATTPLSSLELLTELNNYGLYNMLLMNMAAHPQLSGSKLAPFAELFVPDTIQLTTAEEEIEKEFLAFKSKAYKDGFCKENPSLLWIKHIFIDIISNQLYYDQNTHNNIGVKEIINI